MSAASERGLLVRFDRSVPEAEEVLIVALMSSGMIFVTVSADQSFERANADP